MGEFASAQELPERMREEVLHLRKLAFRALKYFSLADEHLQELRREYALCLPAEKDRLLKGFYRKLVKRFHPDVRNWFGHPASAPTLADVHRAYVGGDLHWLVWADIEYGISTLELREQAELLQQLISNFAHAIRRTRLIIHELYSEESSYQGWMTASALRMAAA